LLNADLMIADLPMSDELQFVASEFIPIFSSNRDLSFTKQSAISNRKSAIS